MARLLLSLVAAAILTMGAAPPTLSPDGLGWLKIGMSDDEAKAAAPTPSELIGGEDPSACGEYSAGRTGGVTYITQELWVSRVTVSQPGVITREGVQVGDTAAKVRDVYGAKVEKESAPYGDPPAEDLYVWLTPDRGYRFEVTDKGVVATIHAGSETIRWIEGCL